MASRRGGKSTTKPAASVPSTSSGCNLVTKCRLCESPQGPFVEIFDGVTSQKLEELLPFVISESDGLPHKICFRCSAKVEELYEFIQKCINTQKSLRKSKGLGWTAPLLKVKTHRSLWEEKLTKSNISNDAICNAAIKKAMEGIKDITVPEKPSGTEDIKISNEVDMKMNNTNNSNNSVENIKDTQVRTSRSRSHKTDISKEDKNKDTQVGTKRSRSHKTDILKEDKNGSDTTTSTILNITDNNTASSNNTSNSKTLKKDKEDVKSFNILDNVVKVKVEGVGTLFQCKLCNRNFLEYKVLLSHWCAKFGSAKEDVKKNVLPPDPPKIPNIKYIRTNSKEDKIDSDVNVKKKPQKDVKAYFSSHSSKEDVEEKQPLRLSAKTESNQSATLAPASSSGLNESIIGTNIRNNIVTYSRRRKKSAEMTETNPVKKQRKTQSVINNEVISLENTHEDDRETQQKNSVIERPYPVGLIQKVSHSNSLASAHGNIMPFNTMVQKNQSYKVIQTSHPNKLLISTKSSGIPHETQNRNSGSSLRNDLFTFVNVDPSATPMYVLPEDNMQHHDQEKNNAAPLNVPSSSNRYKCPLCDLTFSREQGVLAHLKSHYDTIDEVHKLQVKNTSKKGARRN